MKQFKLILSGLLSVIRSVFSAPFNVITPGRKRLTGWVFTTLLLVMASCLPVHAVQRNFQNNGFESIWGSLVGASNWCWVGQSTVPPWISNDTTADNGQCDTYNSGSSGTGNIIELWFNNFLGAPARSGNVLAELNANTASTLHQDVCMLQNEDVTWRLSHRGRDGIDRMQYYVGNTATGLVLDASTGNTGATAINACQSGSAVTTVNGCTQTTVNTWGDYGGSFKWLGPSAVTSINFQAISTSGGNLTVGNLLDEVYFYLKPVIEFSASDSSGLESVAMPASPKLHVVGTLTSPLNISVSIIGGTALLGTDYTTPGGAANFTVTIPVGTYSETDLLDTGIQIINDRVVNGNRTIVIQVLANSAYIISSSQTCGQDVNTVVTYTIIDDDASLRLIKNTIGGTGAFNYSLTNVDTDLVTAGNQTAASITTTTANTPVEFDANSGTGGTQPIVVATVGADVNITETVPSGWSVSGSCSVTGGSNPTGAPIAINTGGAVTIPAANVTAGSVMTCTYTNTKSLSLTKSFNTGTIGVGQTARLTYIITNPAGASAQTGLSFTDTFPANLVVATTPNVVNSCSGTTPAPAGGATAFVVTSVNAAPGTSTCTISVDVTSTAPGSYVNGAGQITAISPLLTNGVTNQTLNVVQAGLTKSFFPATINQGGTSTLTFTLVNGTGNPAQSGINFTDTLPTNVTVAGAPNITTTCPSGTGVVTASGGSGTIAVTGTTMSNTLAFCTISVDVTSNTLGGPYNNTSGSISGLARLTNNVVTSELTVQGANLTKSFSAGSIGVGQTARLTFAIQNPAGSGAKTGLSFTDAFPSGLVIAGTPNVVNNCGGTTPAPSGGATSFVVSSVNSAAGPSTCTIAVDVTSTTAASYVNGSGQITAISGMANNVTDQTLNVVPVALTKSYSPATVDVGSSSTLTFTLTNGSGNPAQTGLAFTDTFPAGLTVTAVSGISGTGCSGTPGRTASTFTLSGGAITSGNSICTFTATVRGDTAGTYNNVAGNISGSSSRINYSGVNSTLTVVTARPTLTKAYSTTTIAKGATSTLTFTITNSAGNGAKSGIAFTDTFPTGLTVTAVSALSTGCTSTPSPPSFTANSVTLAAGTMASGRASCTFTATVRGDTEGSYINTNANFSGQTNINTTATTATLAVYAPPTVTKSFGAISIPSGGNTTLTLTLTNPATNPGNLTTMQVIDNFPTGMTPLNTTITYGANTGCGTVTLTDAGGGGYGVNDTGIRFRATPAGPGAVCQVTINVDSSTVGYVTNTTNAPTATGPVALSGTAASAPLSIGAPTLTKAYSSTTIGSGSTSTLTFTITNATGSPAQSGIAFTDTFPSGLTITAVSALSTGCTSTPSPPSFTANTITLSAGTMASGRAACTFTATVRGDAGGTYVNNNAQFSGQTQINTSATTATLNVRQVSLNKAFSPTTIDQGGTSTLTFTLSNGTGNPAQNGINFTDTLPANVTVAGTPNITTSCPSGTGVITATGGTITVSGATMNNAQASCTITVDVTSNVPGGPYNNTSTNIGNTAHLTNSVTSSGLTVRAYPILTKAFGGTATIEVGQTNILTFTITNNVTNNIARAALAFTDTLPGAGGLTAGTTTPQCGGTVTVSGANNNILSFSGGSVAAGGTCTITATVNGVTAGSYINGPNNSSISGVSTTLSNGVTDQTLVVIAFPSITVIKSVQTYADPINATSSPKDIPGAVMLYTIQVINSGPGAVDINSTVITDPIPANTVMCVTSACNDTNPPVTFSCSAAPLCGLSFDAATDVTYSYQAGGGAPYVYPPTSPDGAGFDSNVKQVRVNPKGVFNGASGGNNSNFEIKFKVKIQ